MNFEMPTQMSYNNLKWPSPTKACPPCILQANAIPKSNSNSQSNNAKILQNAYAKTLTSGARAGPRKTGQHTVDAAGYRHVTQIIPQLMQLLGLLLLLLLQLMLYLLLLLLL